VKGLLCEAFLFADSLQPPLALSGGTVNFCPADEALGGE